MPGSKDEELRLTLAVDGVEAVPAATGQATAAVRAFGDEVEKTNGRVRTSHQSVEHLNEEHKKLNYNVHEAQHAIRELGMLTGVHMPRMVANFVAHLDSVGPILAAAFTPIALLALLEVIEKIPEAVGKATDKIMGFGEAEKTAAKTAIESNKEYITLLDKIAEAHRHAESAGLVGSAKTRSEIEAIKEQGAEAAKHVREYAGWIEVATNRLHELEGLFHTPTRLVGAHDNEIEQLKEQIKSYSAIQAKYALEAKEAADLKPIVPTATLGVEAAEIARANAMAEAEAAKSADTARLKAREEVTRHLVAMGGMTQAQQTSAAITGENERFEIEKTFLAAKRANAEREARETGKDVSTELKKLDSEIEDAALNHETALNKIRDKADEEQKKKKDELAKDEIEGSRRLSEEDNRIAEQTNTSLYSLHKISADNYIDNKQLEAKRAHDIEVESTDKLIALETAKAEPSLKVLDDLNRKKLESLMRFNAATETNERERDKIHQEEAYKSAEEDVSIARSSADRQLSEIERIASARLSAHRISHSTFVREETDAIEEWYRKQKEVLDRWLELVKNIYGEGSNEYKAAKAKEDALDQQRSSKIAALHRKDHDEVARFISEETHTVLSAYNGWIMGQESFHQAAVKMWQDVEMNAVRAIEAIIEKKIEEMVIDRIINALFGEQQSPIEKAAQQVAANASEAESYAGLNAAQMFAYYIPSMGLGAIGPAAAALGLGEGFAGIASAQRGAVLAEDSITLLHKREMVLPEHLSTAVQQMAAGGGSARPMAFHYAPVIHAMDSSGVEDVLNKHSDTIAGIIKRQFRNGAFG